MSALTAAVKQALGSSNLVTAAADVKQLVCDELARVDPDADIRRTDYFNHTYIPDVVVRWGSDAPREVYLRFMAPDTVNEDVHRIGGSGPVILDLSNAISNEADQRAETVAATKAAVEHHPTVLVTDTEATEHIRPASAANFVEHLVVSNLLRSGRGPVSYTHLTLPTIYSV